VTKQEVLEAALVKAEAALSHAISNATKADADLTDANDNIEKARAFCRQAHAALVKVKRLEQ
jgi:hypothetical protein